MIARTLLTLAAAAVAAAGWLVPLSPTQPGTSPAAPAEQDDDEQSITLADAPTAVQAAVARLTAPTNIRALTRETEDGLTTYEISYTDGAAVVDVEMSADGNVLETERTVAPGDLPAAALAALQHRHAGATLAGVTRVTVTYYEVKADVNGTRIEMKVSASGELIDDDDDPADEDGEPDGGEGR